MENISDIGKKIKSNAEAQRKKFVDDIGSSVTTGLQEPVGEIQESVEEIQGNVEDIHQCIDEIQARIANISKELNNGMINTQANLQEIDTSVKAMLNDMQDRVNGELLSFEGKYLEMISKKNKGIRLLIAMNIVSIIGVAALILLNLL